LIKDIENYYNFLIETTYQAGKLTLGYFQSNVAVEFKSDYTPVTIADQTAEDYIRSAVEKKYPHHAIVGEERGNKETSGSAFRWIIDPIDGTKSFIRGVPLYATLVALEIEGEVQAGAAYFPALDELVCAATGLGCYWNGRLARVSENSVLEKAFLTCTSPGNFTEPGKREALERLGKRTYFQAGWGDAYGYALVATGRVEIMLDPGMATWDAGPLLPILREAGGYFGDWKGNPTIYGKEGMATNLPLLPQVLEILNA
jgi:myo-inositol-1(or 4)-monophosphatase